MDKPSLLRTLRNRLKSIVSKTELRVIWMVTKYGQKIDYLRLSITDACNLGCRYCMPEDCSKNIHQETLSNEEIVLLVRTLTELGIRKVRLTGGEPLLRKNIIKLVGELSQIKEIEDLSLTTNGILLAEYAQQLRDAGLDRVNISMDTLNAEKYAYLTRGGDLLKVLNGIQTAKAVGFNSVKINVVVIKELNTDEIDDFIDLAADGIEVRFIELMPSGQTRAWSQNNFVSNKDLIEKYGHRLIKKIDCKNSTAQYFESEFKGVRVGFISPVTNAFCDSCNKIRITSSGHLKTCLQLDSKISLKNYLKKPSLLKLVLQKSIERKPLLKKENEGKYNRFNDDMYRIGG